jgi:hypothetical protein
MTDQPTYSIEEIAAFAKRYGLTRLKPEHLARMRELAPYVSDLGRTLPRVASKHDGPAAFR